MVNSSVASYLYFKHNNNKQIRIQLKLKKKDYWQTTLFSMIFKEKFNFDFKKDLHQLYFYCNCTFFLIPFFMSINLFLKHIQNTFL